MDIKTQGNTIATKHYLYGDIEEILINWNKTVLLLNAHEENWNMCQWDGGSVMYKRIVYLHADSLMGTREWQWTQLAQALKDWDGEFANWLEKNAHRAKEAERLLPAKTEQANKRSGCCVVVVEHAERLQAKKTADWQQLVQLTQQALVFVLVANEPLRDMQIDKAIHTTNCSIADFYLNLNQLSIFFAATGVVLNPPKLKAVYEMTQGWTFAVLLINAYIKHGQPLGEDDLHIAITGIFNAFDAGLFPKDAPEQKLAILLSQFEEFTYRMAVEVSPFSENVVKNCFNRLPGLQYKNHGSRIALHPFMRRYLENKLYEIPKKMRDTCVHRAVLWHMAKEEYLPALRFGVMIKDYDNLRTILRRMNVHRCYGQSKAMCKILSEIPLEDLQKHPMIWMYKVLCYHVAEEYLLGQEEKKMLEAYLAQHPDTAEQRQAMGELCALEGFMHFGLPGCIDDFKKAAAYIDDASEIWDGRYSDFVTNGTSMFYYSEDTGYTLRETAESLPEIESFFTVLFNNWGRGFSHLGLAEYYYLVGDDLAMLDNANRAVQLAVAHQQWDVAGLANYALAEQHIKEGRFNEGLYAWRNIHQLAKQKKSIKNHLDDVVDFTVYCVTGQPYLAAGWIQDERPQPAIFQEFEPGRYLYARCVYTVLQGEHIKSLSLIDDALGRSSTRNQWYITSKLKALKMMVLVKLGMVVPACQLLNEFYGMLQKHGCGMFMTEFGETLSSIEQLAEKASAIGIETPPQAWIKQTIGTGQIFEENKRRFRAAYFEKLQEGRDKKFSPREYIALQMSCLGYERKDIARCLDVNTKYVSAIMNKVCSKLKVKNAQAAIMLGRSQGMHNDTCKLLQ